MDRWCKWYARWTENPEVLVQLKVDPPALVVQWIEFVTTDHAMRVRVLPRVQIYGAISSVG